MANTYTLIEAKTLGSAVASVTFSSIPQTYTDLLLRISPRSDWTAGTDALQINFNGSSSSQTYKTLLGSGSSATSGSGTVLYCGEANTASQTASTFSSHDIYIPNYAGSKNKSVSVDSVEESNSTTVYAALVAALWSDTSAITSIACFLSSASNFVVGSNFYLYGIKSS